MKKLSKSFRRILFVSLLIIGTIAFSSMRLNATIIPSNPLSFSSLTPHDSISINQDSDFLAFPGSGTAEDPYIIEGYNITTTDFSGIYITNTTKYFTVRNCYVDADDYGIYFRSVADGTATVINNTCSKNNRCGIYIRYSVSSTVVNNTCENNNQNGINLESSESSTVANNTCNNNNWAGIRLCYSGSSTVTNNTCNSNNSKGIRLEGSGNSTVANNTCNNNKWGGFLLVFSRCLTVVNNTCNNNKWGGIKFDSSGSSTVINNTFTNCGLDIDESSVGAYLSYTLENNWVNGKKLGFFTNLDSTTIAEPAYGQLILVNCTGVTVRDQILNSATVGLFLFSCTSSTIICNTCNNGYRGIVLRSSGSSTVVNNKCNNNIDAISLSYSGRSTVVNNTCSNNWFGILIGHSDFCVVTYNLLQENTYCGVVLNLYSDNNLIHHNTFVDNYLGETSQALDFGSRNTWYDSTTNEGNYWSDWSGTGSYPINGLANSEDLYPLEEPVEYSTVEIQVFFTFTLLIVVVPLLLMKLFSRKRRKMD